MNERIKQLAKRAGLGETNNGEWYPLPVGMEHIKHFAELVRQDEREKCAKLCDPYDSTSQLARGLAQAIRGRTE
jgi:hypothetical protein